MSKKDSKKTSTNDIFLKVMSRQKEETKEDKSDDKQDDNTISMDTAYITGMQALGFTNRLLDKMLATKGATKILSFVITILLVASLNGGSINNLFSTPTSGDVLTDVPVEVTGLSKDNVINGVVDTVEVMVTGSSLDIYALKAFGEYSVYIDVTNLGEGEHTVEFKTKNITDDLTAVVIPSSIVVKIDSKVTQTFPLSYRFINEDSLEDGQSVALLDIDLDTIEVKGSQEAIDSIVSVEANIDVQDVDTEFSQEAYIVAYDSEGNEVAVEFGQETTNVTCRVDSYSKTVPLLVRTQGTLAQGMMIEDIVLSDNEVTLYGSEDSLDDVTAAYVYVDVTNIEADTTRSNASIRSIEGVNKMSISTIDAIVTVDKEDTVSFKDVEIEILNTSNNTTVELDTTTINVTLTGASSVIHTLDESSFQVVVDVVSLGEGTHTVALSLIWDETYVTYELSKTEVEVTIEK